jgi:hypothetical protein
MGKHGLDIINDKHLYVYQQDVLGDLKRFLHDPSLSADRTSGIRQVLQIYPFWLANQWLFLWADQQEALIF